MDLHINTEVSHFTVIDTISSVDREGIEGLTGLAGCPLFMGIEALAQLGGLHARYLTAFEKHCFLLVIDSLDASEGSFPEGTIRLRASLETRTQRAFSYAVIASKDGADLLHGRFIIGTLDYDQQFRRECLEPHYRKVFSCLTQGLPKDSH